MTDPLSHHLAVALGIGVIVGFERGWETRAQHGGERLAGIRTFSLAGLFGGVLGALSVSAGTGVLAAGTLALGALVAGGYVLTTRRTHDFGMTTELALLLTFALGALATLGKPFEAAAAAIGAALLLGLKPEFHRTIERLERAELLATLQLAAIAAVLVPLLPARDLGPFQAINPRVVGMLVLLIAGLSYLGYFAVRLLGPKAGTLVTALLGGLSSSTAVTLAYARRAREHTGSARLLAAGIALAAAIMAPRLAVEIAAVNASLLAALWPTFAALTAVCALGAVAAARAAGPQSAPVELSNPLQLRAALAFGALLCALLVAIAGLKQTLGDAGVYAMSALAALIDVDSVGLALARGAAHGDVEPGTAARAIAVAVLVNTAGKAVLAAALGGAALRRSATPLLLAALGAGTAAALGTLG